MTISSYLYKILTCSCSSIPDPSPMDEEAAFLARKDTAINSSQEVQKPHPSSLEPLFSTTKYSLGINDPLPRWQDSKKEEIKKLGKKALKIKKLEKLELLCKGSLSTKEIKESLKTAKKIKKFIKENSLGNFPIAFNMTINNKPLRFEVYDRIDGKKDIILIDLIKQGNGATKTFYNSWLISNKPKSLAYLMTSLFDEKKISLAKNEDVYLNFFKKSPFIARPYKCAYFIDDGIKPPIQSLILRRYSCDLITTLSLNNFTDREKIDIAIAATKCLDFLHNKNIIHKDIKPENYLVKKKQLFLCDFAMSFNPSNQKCSVRLSTPNYSSFEDLDEFFNSELPQPETPPSELFAKDIWSLGCTFWIIFSRSNIPWHNAAQKNNFSLIKSTIEKYTNAEPAKGTLYHLFWRMIHLAPLKRPSTKEILDELQKIKKELPQGNTYNITGQFKYLD